MIFRGLDADSDFTFGSGVATYARAQEAIVLNIRTRLAFWLNDFFGAMQFGIDWTNLLGGKNPQTEQLIIVQTRAMLAQSFGVVRIISVNTSIDSGTRRLTVTFIIDTIYSRSVRLSVTP